MADEPGTHRYHAEATALEGQIDLPFSQPIERQAFAKITGERSAYLSQHSDPFRVEGIVSYGAAHTQVSGHEEDKHGNPFITLSTSVVEDLNILNVVTADRVVAQISTEHPRDGSIPTVTFLGSQFVNLRIAGHPVEVVLDWDILRDYPGGTSPITQHKGFLDCIGERLGLIRDHKDAPQEFKDRYASNWCKTEAGEATDFSLFKGFKGDPYPGCFGHAIDIPHFGKVLLAVVRIEHSKQRDDVYRETLIDLTMIEVKMGCIAKGSMQVSMSKTNGGPTTGGG